MDDTLKVTQFTIIYPATYPLYRLRQALLEKLLLRYFSQCHKLIKSYHGEMKDGCCMITLEMWQAASIKTLFFHLQPDDHQKGLVPLNVLIQHLRMPPGKTPVPQSISALQASERKWTPLQRQLCNSCQFSFLVDTCLIFITAPPHDEVLVQYRLVTKLASLFPQAVFIVLSTALRAVFNPMTTQQAEQPGPMLPIPSDAPPQVLALPVSHPKVHSARRVTSSTPLLLKDIRLQQRPFKVTTSSPPLSPSSEESTVFSPAQLLREQQRSLASLEEQHESAATIPALNNPADWYHLLDQLCAHTHLREVFVNSRFSYDAQGLKYVLTDRAPGLVHTYAAVLKELYAAIYGQPLEVNFISTNKATEYSPHASQVYPLQHLIPRLRWSLTPAHWQAIVQAVPLTTLAYTVLASSRLEIIEHREQQILANILVRSTIPQSLLQQVRLAIQDTITKATGTNLVIQSFQLCLDLNTPAEHGIHLVNPVTIPHNPAPLRRIYQVLLTPQKIHLAQRGQWAKLVQLCNQQLVLPPNQYFHYRDKHAIQNFLVLLNAVTFKGTINTPQTFRLQLRQDSPVAGQSAQAQAVFLQFNEVISYIVMEPVSFHFEDDNTT